MSLLLELGQNLFSVFFPGQAVHDLKLCELEIYWVIVLAKENLHIVSEHGRTSLDDQKNIPQCYILHFRTRRQGRDYRENLVRCSIVLSGNGLT